MSGREPLISSGLNSREEVDSISGRPTAGDREPDVVIENPRTGGGGGHSSRREVQYSDDADTPIDTDKLLISGAKQIISLFIPVSCCMLLVVAISCTVKYYSHSNIFLIYTPFQDQNVDKGTLAWQSFANAFIFMGIVVVMTIVLVLLFKYECYRLINGWLVVTTCVVLFVLTLMCLVQIVDSLHLFVDYVSICIMMWNFGVVGILTIHWKGPLLLQQVYLIIISAQMALVFVKFIPKWTCWVLLGVLAVWDLIAVLCPRGPLRMLVEMAQEREKPLFPALIYSTNATIMVKREPQVAPITVTNENVESPTHQCHPRQSSADGRGDAASSVPLNRAENSTPQRADSRDLESSDQARAAVSALNGHSNTEGTGQDNGETRRNRLRSIQEDLFAREDRGVKLGLGDFVFYSLLMGRAALDGDSSTILACYVSILVGMCLTILLLAIAGRALPALPISIAFGIIFYFVTSLIISPFINKLALTRVFI